jgi:adenylate kinase family enzyme
MHHTITASSPVCGLILGASGSGKGFCVGSIFNEYHGVHVFVTGDWCREHAAEHASHGVLVDDDLINRTVETHFKSHADPFYVIDAPRSVPQATFFLEMFRRRYPEGRIVVFHVQTSHDQSFALIRHRAERQGREDDAKPEAVEKRLSTYFKKGGVLHTVIPFLKDRVDHFVPITHNGFNDPLNATDEVIDSCVEATRLHVKDHIAPRYFSRPHSVTVVPGSVLQVA